MTKKRDEARIWLTVNQSNAVQAWLEKYIEYLNKCIERTKISEERAF